MPLSARWYFRLALAVTAVAAATYLLFFAWLSLNNLEVTLFSVIPDIIAKVILFAAAVPGTFLLLYAYPSLVAQGRKTEIDLDLPYVITYMQALASTMTLYEVIRKVYEEVDLFGEVSKEFGIIVRDVELFGKDLLSAMRDLQIYTPSRNFSEFLNDLATLADTGGDVMSFLAARSDSFREAAEREMEMTLKTIEIMAEVYVTAFVAGPIALITMLVAQNVSGQQGASGWMLLLSAGIPAGALVMIGLLHIILPPENLKITGSESVESEFGGDVRVMAERQADRKFMKDLRSRKQVIKIRMILRHPFRHYISDYTWSLILGTVSAGFVVFSCHNGFLAPFFLTYPFEVMTSLAVIAFMLPVMVAYEGRRWYVRSIEAQLPVFLRELIDMRDVGMTLHGAIHRISRSKIGVLNSELKGVSDEIRRGVPTHHALVRMEKRIGLVQVKRAISMLVKSSQITDDLRGVLMIAIRDFEHYIRMKKERSNTSFAYVAIVYLSFGVFLYTAYQLSGAFVSSFLDLGAGIDLSADLTGIFHIGIILGAVSGIMAGQFSSNTVLAGFKHSIILLSATLFMFLYVIGC